MSDREPWRIVRLLAVTQIISWGSLFYAFAILAADVQRELGWRNELVFGAYSLSLLVAGLAATPAGMLIDRIGGRLVMACGSVLAAAGIALVGIAGSVWMYFAGWIMVGIAMSAVLYEAAFATINREFLHAARQGISVLTLFGGLASTLFWPLTLKLNELYGWRDTLLIYAAVHLLLCAPLHALLGAGTRPAGRSKLHVRGATLGEAVREPAFWLLAVSFSCNMFVFSALAVHLIPLLQRFGHSAGTAVLVATLIGPMQVVGRIAEMTLGSRLSPSAVGRITFAVMPAALLALLFYGAHAGAVAVFCILYGASNGVLTIVRGTLPQELFGRDNYGAIAGALNGPSLVAKALGPLLAAMIVGWSPAPSMLLGILLAVALFSLLCFLAAVRARAGA